MSAAIGPVAVVQHVDHEGPGLIRSVLEERGAPVSVVRPYRGEELPGAGDVAALVVMGGPMSALDDDEHPHLARERSLLADAVAAGTPVLGVCLGAQLLAVALGGSLIRGRVPENELGGVTLTDDARSDPVFGPVGRYLPVLHWHNDTFTLPPDAVRIASNDRFSNQAFRIGRAYGLQFHVEVDPPTLETYAPHLPPDMHLDARHAALVTRAGRGVLGRWADQLLRVTA